MPAVVYQFVADVSEFQQNVGQVSDSLEDADNKAQKMGDTGDKAGKKAGKGFRNAAGAAGALAAAALTAGAAIGKLTQEAADLVNDLNDLSAKTGVSAETLNGLTLAFEGSGQKGSALERVLKTLPQRILDTSEGTGKAARGFDTLGISVTDAEGNLRSSDDVLKETLAGLQAMEDPTLKAAAATDIFGTSGTKLIQAIGDVPLEAFTAQANQFGTDVGPEASQAAAEWQREMASLSNIFRGTLTEVLRFASGGIEGIRAFQVGFVAAKAAIIQAITEILDDLGDLGDIWKAVFSLDFETAVTRIRDRFAEIPERLQRVAGAAAEAGVAFALSQREMAAAAQKQIDLSGAVVDGAEEEKRIRGEVAEASDAAAEAATSALDAELDRWKLIGEQLDAIKTSARELDRIGDEAIRKGEEFEAIQKELPGLIASNVESTTANIGQLLEGTSAEAGAAAQAIFRVNQAAALTNIAIHTAEAVARVWGQTGLLGVIAQAAPIAMGASQAALVLAQKPPQAHAGAIVGRSDEVNIRAQSGESVLSRAATQRLGRDNVQRLNAGQGMQRQAAPVAQYRHEVFNRFAADNLRRRDSPIRRAVKPRNSRIGQV